AALEQHLNIAGKIGRIDPRSPLANKLKQMLPMQYQSLAGIKGTACLTIAEPYSHRHDGPEPKDMALPERCQQDLERLIKEGNRNLGLNLVVDSAATDHSGRCTIVLKPHGVKCLDDRLKPLQPYQPTPRPLKDQINRFAGGLSQFQFNNSAKDIEVKTRQPVHVKEVARNSGMASGSSPTTSARPHFRPLAKPFLKGAVGRAANAKEDVALVQAALSNLNGPDGQPYWRSGITGTGTSALITAIKAFETSLGQTATGKMEPKSQAEAAMVNMLPGEMKHLRCVPGTNAVYCTTNPTADIEQVARKTEHDRTLDSEDRKAIARLQRDVARETGLCLVYESEHSQRQAARHGKLRRKTLTLKCADTIWLDRNGRPKRDPNAEPVDPKVMEQVSINAQKQGLKASANQASIDIELPDYDAIVDEALDGLVAELTAFSSSMHNAPEIREQYRRNIATIKADVIKQMRKDRLTLQQAAERAVDMRDRYMKTARNESKDLAKALAAYQKAQGKAFPELEEEKAKKLFGKSIAELTEKQKRSVWKEIIDSSMRDNPLATKWAKKLGGAAKNSWYLTVAIGTYQILESENPEQEAVNVAATAAGGVVGGKVGTLVGFAVCGPVCAIGGFFIGSALGGYAAEELINQ
ncbi:MAG: hypothetical protein ACPG06_07525, partial [Alphaproteobacteria bacterium]